MGSCQIKCQKLTSQPEENQLIILSIKDKEKLPTFQISTNPQLLESEVCENISENSAEQLKKYPKQRPVYKNNIKQRRNRFFQERDENENQKNQYEKQSITKVDVDDGNQKESSEGIQKSLRTYQLYTKGAQYYMSEQNEFMSQKMLSYKRKKGILKNSKSESAKSSVSFTSRKSVRFSQETRNYVCKKKRKQQKPQKKRKPISI